MSEVPIAFKEYTWQEIFSVLQSNKTFTCRYVDNRLLALPNFMDCLPHWKILTHLDFYGKPVELEKEPGMTFLGFDIDIEQGLVSYVFPSETWHYRSPKSAGKLSILLSGLVSRVHLIARHSYPDELIIPAIKNLITLYVGIGFTIEQMLPILRRTLNAYRINISDVV